MRSEPVIDEEDLIMRMNKTTRMARLLVVVALAGTSGACAFDSVEEEEGEADEDALIEGQSIDADTFLPGEESCDHGSGEPAALRMTVPGGPESAEDILSGRATPNGSCPVYRVNWGTLGLRTSPCGEVRENMEYGEIFHGRGATVACGEWWIYGARHRSGHWGWTRHPGLVLIGYESC